MVHLLSERKLLCNQDTHKAHKCCLFVFNSCPGGRLVQCFFICVPPHSPSLQLALRAPSSHSRGQDYVSNVRSTVAPPSRLPHFAVVGTAITAETWTNRRMCAPVSQSLSVKQAQKAKTLYKPFRVVIAVYLRVIETCL